MHTSDGREWIKNKGEGIRIVLIDSGVNSQHVQLKDNFFTGISVKRNSDDEIVYTEGDMNDELGHGTAICYILKKVVPKAEIFVVKLFHKDFSTSDSDLIEALRYVYELIPCDIIHLSSGVVICEELKELKDICRQITQKGIILIAAFDNDGALSYPAAFSDVVGVDISISCTKIYDYEFVESKTINIRGLGIEQRLPWVGADYKDVSGASFAAPYITGYVARIMEGGKRKLPDILAQLKSSAKKVYKGVYSQEPQKSLSIEKAVIFPFNKEMHSVARFHKMMKFKLTGIYDSKFLGNVGKKVSVLLNAQLDNDFIVQNIEMLDWNSDFDTFILGHVRELSNALGRDLKLEILTKCVEHGKKVYAFDDLSSYQEILSEFDNKGIEFFYPGFLPENLPKNRFGKLRKVAQPVLGVFGTSPRQGKFTLQLLLRKMLLEQGYSVGQLGTEPTSLLFDIDEVYPMGYDATVKVSGWEAVAAVNYLMGRIEDRNPDIIIVGSQSQTIPSATGNLGLYPVSQHELILGSEPDAYILCVNIFDDLDYIKRTIKYMESIIPADVIALVLFPLKRNFNWSILGSAFISASIEELEKKRSELQTELNKRVFLLGKENDMKELFTCCIDYFTCT